LLSREGNKEVIEMNKALAIFAVVFLLTLAFAADSHAGSSMIQIGFRGYDATKLVGSMVTTIDGEDLGRILDLELNSQEHVVFALIVQNGVDEFPGRLVAVPFSALTIAEETSKPILVLLNVDKENFYTAPSFDAKDLDNPQWVTGLYRFFGQQPYWTEEEPGKDLCAYPYSLLK
jgi:sporulation protein YlmC with PRC-barrel domain